MWAAGLCFIASVIALFTQKLNYRNGLKRVSGRRSAARRSDYRTFKKMLRRSPTKESSAARPPSLGKPTGRRLRELLLGPDHSSSAVLRGESAVGGGGETVVSCHPSLAPRPAARSPDAGPAPRSGHTREGAGPARPNRRGLVVLRPLQSLTKDRSMATRNTVRTREDRRALLESMSLAECKFLQRKARVFAAFAGARWPSEDLFQTSLLAALEGRPAWRTTQSLSDYCATVMASRVGFSAPKRVGRRE